MFDIQKIALDSRISFDIYGKRETGVVTEISLEDNFISFNRGWWRFKLDTFISNCNPKFERALLF